MDSLLAGSSLFIIASITATILQNRSDWTYSKNPIRFSVLFLVLLSAVAFVFKYKPSISIAISITILALLYILLVRCMVSYWKPMNSLHAAASVPKPYVGLVKPEFSGQFVKVVELLLQDVAAWLIVTGLFSVFFELDMVVFIFTLIVFLLHIPAPKLFGKVYGTYFLILSTTLAFLVPLLYQYGEVGFTALYLTHISGYILMYLLFGWWGRKSLP